MWKLKEQTATKRKLYTKKLIDNTEVLQSDYGIIQLLNEFWWSFA